MSRRKVADSFDLSSFLPSKIRSKQSVPAEIKDVPIDNTIHPAMHIEPPMAKEAVALDADNIDDGDNNDVHEPIPTTHNALLQGHTRCVSALSLDASGSRLISGGADFSVKMWDFNGMSSSLQSFRTVIPWEGYNINDLQFSKTGEMFLVASGSSEIKLYDRDGIEVQSYTKGDVYMRDMRNTRGHIASITCAQWHPSNADKFMSASEDSTIRIWSVENKMSAVGCIIGKQSGAGHRSSAAVTAACFTNDGKMIAGAVKDGSLSLWDWDKPYLKPAFSVPNAHIQNTITSKVAFAKDDDFALATRGGDDTMKLWDLRMFSKPIHMFSDLSTNHASTDLVFSPSGRYICTGTSVKKGEDTAKLLVYDRYTFELVNETHVTKSSVVRILWHPKLNQIMTGNGDGSISCFYDSTHSQKGVLLSLSKGVRKRKVDTIIDVDMSYTPGQPNAHRDYQSQNPNRKTNRRDPVLTKYPQQAYAFGIDSDAAIKNTQAFNKQQVVGKSLKDTVRDEDPREALLKYAELAESDPKWIAPAYKKNQPHTLYDTNTEQTEAEKLRKVERKQ